MKTCKTCTITKSSEEFYSKRASCKQCDRERVLDKDKEKNRKLKYYYGISLDEYNEMLFDQGGGCKICSRSPEEVGTLVVDHDHNCHPGRRSCRDCIRGLLCQDCNIGLGKFFHNMEILLEAQKYLNEAGDNKFDKVG